MFEKEAEEEINKEHWKYSIFKDLAQEYWQKGAVFGYNKANEWNYVKDKLPPENVPLLCIRGGNIYISWYYDSVYHDSRCCQVKKPYAWKEIELPKEIKEK